MASRTATPAAGRQAGAPRVLASGLALLIVGLWGAGTGASPQGPVPLPPQPDGVPWPTRAWPRGEPAPGVDRAALEEAIDGLFAPVGWSGLPDTRALLVVEGGRLVVERYAPGFDAGTRFHSWSMAKSVTHATLARLAQAGRFDLDAAADVPEWRVPGDPRGRITHRHLLHMVSGLDNADGFPGDPADSYVARLLFSEGSRDVAAMARRVGVLAPPGERWAYSSGTSMVLAWIAGRRIGSGREDTLRFLRRELFHPLGMESAVPEFDAAGTFLGGGFVWATARDWARFGLLYLRGGRWEGRRLVPKPWVALARRRARADGNGSYGGHFWLNLPPAEGQPPRILPGAPPSAFAAMGNSGQMVAIVPTRDLVVVRLGELQTLDWKGLGPALAAVVRAFPDRIAARGGTP